MATRGKQMVKIPILTTFGKNLANYIDLGISRLSVSCGGGPKLYFGMLHVKISYTSASEMSQK